MPSNPHFATALQELIEKRPVQGLFARCFAEAEGDEAKTKAKYIALRSVEIQEEERIANLTPAEKALLREHAEREARETALRNKEMERQNLLRHLTFDQFKQEYRGEVALHYYGRADQRQMFEDWQNEKLASLGYFKGD